MKSLSTKLILAFLAVIVTGTLLSAGLVDRVTKAVVGEFLFNQTQAELAARMAEFYRARGSWAGVERFGGGPGRGGSGNPSHPFALVGPDGTVLLAGLGFLQGTQLSQTVLENAIPIEVDGQEVGKLLVTSRAAFRPSPLAQEFIDRLNRVLWIGALGASLLALLLGLFLARRLTQPLREMTIAAQAVTRGELGIQVPVRSQDEVGELAQAFNQMNAGLVQARDQRRQMTADIAHDLRTPISIISGYATGLADGMLDPNKEMFGVIQDESERLEVLVEDLRLLSLSEADELTFILASEPPAGIVERAAAAFLPQALEKGIKLETRVAEQLPEVRVDRDRIAQVMGHLLENALRHTPEEGEITIAAERAAGGAVIRVVDTGSGIAPEDLPHIFDRFYRGDPARQRAEGGSGLGLAIARSLIDNQGGRIWAESQPGQGTEMVVFLPAAGAGNA